jgi:hypothetical protein
MDTDLRAIFELRRQLQDGDKDQRGIAYKNLWHLYKPGDIVISNPAVLPGPQQAYCVLHVTGGRASSSYHQHFCNNGKKPCQSEDIDLQLFAEHHESPHPEALERRPLSLMLIPCLA